MPKDRTLLVYVDHEGTARLAGRLHTRADAGWETARFVPDRTWRRSPLARLYAPCLRCSGNRRRQGGSMPLFGAVGDSAPDRWGRTLMRRRERRRAARVGREGERLAEVDFLIGVNDAMRAGNLRFANHARGPFLDSGGPRTLPSLASLGALLRAVQAYESDRATHAQTALLLRSGNLLGGSRPKVCVRGGDGALWIAKLPSREDDRDMQRWEALALELAAECGLDVPARALATVEGERVLLLRRFDRESGRRIALLSAFGLLDAQDNETASFVALAEALRGIVAEPERDVAELWRRMLFSVLVSNKDDHLRNHGILLTPEGWRLAPFYDVNAEPQKLRPRELLMSIDGVDDVATLEVAMRSAHRFGFARRDARAEARRMAAVISRWREHAKRLRLPAKEVKQMRPAFEHEDLRAALRA